MSPTANTKSFSCNHFEDLERSVAANSGSALCSVVCEDASRYGKKRDNKKGARSPQLVPTQRIFVAGRIRCDWQRNRKLLCCCSPGDHKLLCCCSPRDRTLLRCCSPRDHTLLRIPSHHSSSRLLYRI